MKIPLSMSINIHDHPNDCLKHPEMIEQAPSGMNPVVTICQNDGTMVYKSWDGLWREAIGHDPHTCTLGEWKGKSK